MSTLIRSRKRRLQGALATLLVAVGGLVAGPTGLTSPQPAAAVSVPCPAHPAPAGHIENWETKWPAPGVDGKGVALCQAQFEGFQIGYLTIVDVEAGARLRIHAQPSTATADPWDLWDSHQLFHKRTADEWYSFLKVSASGTTYAKPEPTRLFSTTNASFFKDTDNDNLTKLPLPSRTAGNNVYWGLAHRDPLDPDHYAEKWRLGLQNPTWQPFPPYDIAPFPTTGYTKSAEGREGMSYSDAIVGFDPLHVVGDRARRNYIGKYGNKMYLFTSNLEYTNAEANTIMQQIQPGMAVMQLDGGGSAQMYSPYGEVDNAGLPGFERKVPDVLAVYTAP